MHYFRWLQLTILLNLKHQKIAFIQETFKTIEDNCTGLSFLGNRKYIGTADQNICKVSPAPKIKTGCYLYQEC